MIQHKHIIIRAEVEKVPGKKELKKWLTKLVSAINMKLLKGPIVAYVDTPGNKGATGVCIIETSHVALHCWEEQDPKLIQLDVYSCAYLDKEIVLSKLQDFNPVKVSFITLDREYKLEITETVDSFPENKV